MTPDSQQQVLPKLPDIMSQAPIFGQSPTGKKPKQKSMTAAYLGADTMPSVANAGFKTLVGQ